LCVSSALTFFVFLGRTAVLPMYIDPAYCYRCSLVCQSVCHDHEPCKNGWTDKMPFGLWTWVCPRNHVLDGVADPPLEGAILRGEGEYCPSVAAMRLFVKLLWPFVML